MICVPQVGLPVCNEGLVLDLDDIRVRRESDGALCSWNQCPKTKISTETKRCDGRLRLWGSKNLRRGYTSQSIVWCLEVSTSTSVSSSTWWTPHAPDKQNAKHRYFFYLTWRFAWRKSSVFKDQNRDQRHMQHSWDLHQAFQHITHTCMHQGKRHTFSISHSSCGAICTVEDQLIQILVLHTRTRIKIRGTQTRNKFPRDDAGEHSERMRNDSSILTLKPDMDKTVNGPGRLPLKPCFCFRFAA